MSTVSNLETKLDDIVNKKAPRLPIGIKRFLFEWSPWIALVVGILSLLSALGLWSAARGIQNSTYVVQQLCSTYAGGSQGCDIPSSVSHLNFWVWLAIISLALQGIFYLRAYPRLRERQKAGWDFLYYAALTSVAYAIITLLTSYDVIGHFISAAIGAAISFYLLFQIRPLFLNARETAPTAAPTPSITKPEIIDAEPEPETAAEPEPMPEVVPKPKAKTKSAPKKKAAKKKTTTKKRPTKKKA